MTITPPTSRLQYVDANTTPWPLNHHAYVYACAERLRKELSHPPRVHFPESHLQRQDDRGALVRLGGPDHDDFLLAWDERRGWARLEQAVRRPLVLGADPLLDPEAFTHAVTALLRPGTRQLVMVLDRSRPFAHPVDVLFERRLAAFRTM
ncbi:hypothetical protein [Nocardiopsis sp. MG754419]|uniref:hypothetical protein n=1 Tax=Nocardiopsis sp. MG754419 TaxID=2259865 RepID=UPI001BAB39F2|nr:hypothetical protein [Nocardiopsis sp. MG754419]MBR8743090.1 hypothetical protein [Nocardiopsis sp. MG754419]